MVVERFDVQQGVYAFELSGIATGLHAHPAVEVIAALSGSFSVATAQHALHGLSFAVIPAHLTHSVNAPNCLVKILMCEHRQASMALALQGYGLKEAAGVLFSDKPVAGHAILPQLREGVDGGMACDAYDDRVAVCLDLLGTGQLNYHDMMGAMQAKVHLSESRISHLLRRNWVFRSKSICYGAG